MGTYTVGRLAKRHGVSRSTLLYYDSLGLLRPSARNSGEYRRYSEEDGARLGRILAYRQMGFGLERIKELLEAPDSAFCGALLKRLDELHAEVSRLRAQQRLIVELLEARGTLRSLEERMELLDKETLVSLLQASGVDREGRRRLHAAFERASPASHQAFLEYLGMPPDEIKALRESVAMQQHLTCGQAAVKQPETPCS